MWDKVESKRSCGWALAATGAPPYGHTNRSTESCGTSVNLTAAASKGLGRCFASSSNKCPNPTVVPRDREERAFVCLEQMQRNAIKNDLGERFVAMGCCTAPLMRSYK